MSTIILKCFAQNLFENVLYLTRGRPDNPLISTARAALSAPPHPSQVTDTLCDYTSNGKRGMALERLSTRGRFNAYAAYAFGVPTALTILLVCLEFSGLPLHPYLPLIRHQGCFLYVKVRGRRTPKQTHTSSSMCSRCDDFTYLVRRLQ
ncbi:hypothetical protein EVAR_49084_1 [Eumeta japonica]|uniref:Uncharacterized protein n=1 Tax=Eumeta variegata TaxID=151549 RepID=A0A4C1Z8X9_EUMVA|nr:hypothetical protein EVAR_49084_1 [Eumeta japonica]